MPGQSIQELVEAQGERTPEAVAVALGGQRSNVAERVTDLWDATVAAQPDTVAVFSPTESVSYAELDRRANQIARYLIELGVGPEIVVGLCLERSADALAALLGVLKAGGAYLPLDPANPHDWIVSRLDDARAPFLLTHRSIADRFPAVSASVVHLERDAAPIRRRDPSPVSTPGRAEQLAYVLHTSGSTGRPKGVAMPHAPLVNLIRWQMVYSAAGVATRTLQYTPLSFDVSFQELFSTWSTGGTLVLIDEATRRDPVAFLRYLTALRVERLFLPFVQLQQLAQAAEILGEVPAALLEVFSAGEQLKITRQIAKLFAQLPGATLHNQYGPTECAVIVTDYTLGGSPADWPELPPIGRPIPGVELLILDESRRPCPDGTPGNLYIAGVCLAREYLHRPDLTAECFPHHPVAGAAKPERAYRTGDLAVRSPDGNFSFLGRADQQVKVRGHRVEPGEVETTLSRCPGVTGCVVVAREDSAGARRLVAYVEAEPAVGTPAEWLAFLGGCLPAYMVPAVALRLDRLPLTSSGKVDRRALPAPPVDREAGQALVAARDDLERRLQRIWEELLGVRPVGVTDQFKDLGGDSLLAATMLLQVRAAFGQDIPLTALGANLTVAALAAVLRTRGGKPPEALSDPLLVPIEPAGNRPPLFWVHGIGGEVLSFVPLVRHLGTDRPSFGFRAQGGLAGEEPLTSLAAMADQYTDLLLRHHPHSGYRLLGYSLGGPLAVEMARRLRARGHAVPFVGVIDGDPPGAPRRARASPRRLVTFTTNAVRWAIDARHQYTFGALLRHGWRKLGVLSGAAVGRRLDLNAVLDASQLSAGSRKLWSALYQAHQEHRMGHYDGMVHVFRARVQPLFGEHAHDLGWSRFAAGVTVHEVPGNHASILREPDLTSLAAAIGHALAAANG